MLAAVEGGKVQIAAGVTADSTAQVKAGELVNFVAQQVGGKGGGKADMAMAGGSDPSRLGEALASVQGWVAERGDEWTCSFSKASRCRAGSAAATRSGRRRSRCASKSASIARCCATPPWPTTSSARSTTVSPAT